MKKHQLTAYNLPPLRILGLLLLLILLPFGEQREAMAKSRVFDDNVKTLQVIVNGDWMAPLPIMHTGTDDVLTIAFDELSHTYHRYTYRLEHCEADWTPSADLFESDWLEGFNNNPIDDYQHSLNTTVHYTHYTLQIPNERCRLKMSGNYRLHVTDDDSGDDSDVLCAEFMVADDAARLALTVTTNTDVDHNAAHQQVAMSLDYCSLRITNPDTQLYTVVMQNGREDNRRVNIPPTQVTPRGLAWTHAKALIFPGGNEYHKFEILDTSHPTMGIDRISWDGTHFNAYPYTDTPRRNYSYDEDANGAYCIRNSDNIETERLCDYVYVHYKLCPAQHYNMARLVVDGQWTTGTPRLYHMTYDDSDHSYNATILQKQGYYSYQYLMEDADGQATHVVPEEGNFSETENCYQALTYYKGTGDRTWLLVAVLQ